MVRLGMGLSHRVLVVGASSIIILFLVFTSRSVFDRRIQQSDLPPEGHERPTMNPNWSLDDTIQEPPQEKPVPSEVPSQIPSEVPPQIHSEVPSQVPPEIPSQAPPEIPSQVPPEIPSQGAQIPDLPADYAQAEKPFCEERFGVAYLEKLRDAATGYCTPASSSNVTCFHSKTDASRVDSFCIGEDVLFDPATHMFQLGCDLERHSSSETSFRIPELNQLGKYWYETGPGVVFDTFIDVKDSEEQPSPSSSSPQHWVLVKREGATNVWHCLMEILSMTFSLDVLRMSSKPNGDPYLTEEDLENTQVVLLDETEDGPFIDLWNLVVGKPVIRLKDMPPSPGTKNIIVPLAGGSNPMWQGDWVPHSCEQSMLLQTFTRRVLGLYNLESHSSDQEPNIIVTFINRTSTRRLIDAELYINKLTDMALPHVTVRSVDFAVLSFQEQLQVAQETDVLIGVHGAGLTHGMFLPPRSTMVELLPSELNHKGFRNMASLMDHTYLSVHSSPKPSSTKGDWHGEDVFVEFDKFLEAVTIAVKGMYNRGGHDYDVS